MPGKAQNARRDELDDFIEAFETALARDGQADLAAYLPPPGHPLYRDVVCELVRIDLEYGWEHGRPRSVEHYQNLFPALRGDPAALQEIAFEEYRLRHQAGDHPTPAEYQERFGVNTAGWPEPQPAAAATVVVVAPASRRGPAASPSHPGAHPGPHANGFHGTEGRVAQADGAPEGDCWLDSFYGDAEHAQLWRDLHRSDPGAAYLLAGAVTALPEVGARFLGFRLIADLGRGGFGRVYLARQDDLANRIVVLKISIGLLDESQTLARLQHTNIVPIYSAHQAGPLQAVCMPYFGSTTLADVLRDLRGQPALPESGKSLVTTLQNRQRTTLLQTQEVDTPPPDFLTAPAGAVRKLEEGSYVEGVLDIVAKLADGLAHAHERGILHRDLKPANILLTDEGQPMLLDFNLSADTQPRAGAPAAQVGGTLPYMSPEHLEMFQGGTRVVDARSDLYALGVILHELLTGRFPFVAHTGPLPDVLPRMLADRRRPPPAVRRWNRAVSPAVESIVRHCLEPDPARRYQSAQDLREDLGRQLAHQPLCHAPEPSVRERVRKWVRRHPRLASPTTLVVSVVALFLVAAVALVWDHYQAVREKDQDLRARERLAEEKKQRIETDQRRAETKSRRAREEARRARENSWRACRDQFDAYYQKLARFEDRLNQAELLADAPTLDGEDLDMDVELCQRAIDLYPVLQDPAWAEAPAVRFFPAAERQQLKKRMGDLLYLLSLAVSSPLGPQMDPAAGSDLACCVHGLDRGGLPGWAVGQAVVHARLRFALQLIERAESCYPARRVPRAFLMHQAALTRALGRVEEAKRLAARAKAVPLTSARDRYRVAWELATQGRFKAALPLLREAAGEAPQDFSVCYLQALCHENCFEYPEAAAWYSTCIALKPKFFCSYLNRGKVYLLQKRWAQAEADFDKVIQAQPQLVNPYIHRANVRAGQGKYREAIRDLTEALERRPSYTVAYFLRAGYRRRVGDQAGAEQDFARVVQIQPTDAEGWTYRGIARAEKRNPEGALADFRRALVLDSRNQLALSKQAHLLLALKRTREAARVLDMAVYLHPDQADFRVKRGLLRAQLGDRPGAHRDARKLLEANPSNPVRYDVACIYALTAQRNPEDRRPALEQLFTALGNGYWPDLVEEDDRLAALRGDPDFQRLLWAVRILRPGAPPTFR